MRNCWFEAWKEIRNELWSNKYCRQNALWDKQLDLDELMRSKVLVEDEINKLIHK